MIRLARVWYNFVAYHHNERALDHARRRDRALRKLERLERRHQARQTQREIGEILKRHDAAIAAGVTSVNTARAAAQRLHLVADNDFHLQGDNR